MQDATILPTYMLLNLFMILTDIQKKNMMPSPADKADRKLMHGAINSELLKQNIEKNAPIS